MGQRAERLPKECPIGDDVGRSDLEHIVKTASDHMALLNFGVALHSAVKVIQGARARVLEPDFNESHMSAPKLNGIQDGAIPSDHAKLFEPL